MNTPNDRGPRKSIRSLSDLPQNIPPPRDLWQGIAAEIAKDAPIARKSTSTRRVAALSGTQWAALAAVIFALAVGIWIGRSVLPAGVAQPTAPVAANQVPHDVVTAAYVRDSRYQRDRTALVRALDEKMKTLPPETQQKVTASLATIRKSIADIQDALGRDPSNALLQELLVNSYQDEMRVLTAVHEAGDGQEI